MYQSRAVVAGGGDAARFAILRRARVRRGNAVLEHDPEKWIPVFGKDHAQIKKPLARFQEKARWRLRLPAALSFGGASTLL